MKKVFAVLAILPLVLTIELLGEELPSEKIDTKDQTPLFDNQLESNVGIEKRSVNIDARRRSALDKTFMRFGRSDPAMSNNRIKLSGANLIRLGRGRPDGFLRLGRAKNDFMRFGRSPNLMRFGRSDPDDDFDREQRANLMRFGRSDDMDRETRAANLMRFGRANNNLMRFGRNPNMMRFGRSGGGNLMRFGRSNTNDDDFYLYDFDDDNLEKEKKANSFLRLGRSLKPPPDPIDRKNDNFMRLGRSTEASMIEMEDNNIEDNNPFDILFSEDSAERRKRSSDKNSPH